VPQRLLFDDQYGLPGFEYHPAFISAEEERRLLETIANIEFSQVAMRGGIRPYLSPQEARNAGVRRTTHETELAPRSAYLIRGKARRDFEHSIPPVEKRRYSITFRTVTR
jgi:hypothetical protein